MQSILLRLPHRRLCVVLGDGIDRIFVESKAKAHIICLSHQMCS
jgi:hypothetical protein